LRPAAPAGSPTHGMPPTHINPFEDGPVASTGPLSPSDSRGVAMRLLVVGSGAREHAFVWKLASEEDVSEVLCAPGNAGIQRLARTIAGPIDPQRLLAIAVQESVDLTVIGPEIPLFHGVADLFSSSGQLLFGPTRAASELEWSKVFAKEFMARHRVPTARYRTCTTADEALAAVEDFDFPVVLKADGLAAGKGVVVAGDRVQAAAAIREMIVERKYGEAGARIVVEEHLDGREASFFVLTDGTRALPLGSAEDHKRAFDGDNGPNTGGMGAFAPSPIVDPAIESRVMNEIVLPVVDGLRHEGREYRGFLYVGLMLTADGPKVVEFNARFGDPEAQVVVPLVDEPLLPLLMAAASGRLRDEPVRLAKRPHVGVVAASAGYPEAIVTGKLVRGLDAAESMADVLVFHAGTTLDGGKVLTSGGRVLTVVGLGADYREAIARAYEAISLVHFDGIRFRTDIGARALQPLSVDRTGARLPARETT
jgi:phosphoribosylamine---glycine ligase